MSFYNHMRFIFYSILVLVLIENDLLFPQSYTPQSLASSLNSLATNLVSSPLYIPLTTDITEAMGKLGSYSVFCILVHYLIPKGHKYPLRDNQGNRHSIPIYQLCFLPRTPPRSDLARSLQSVILPTLALPSFKPGAC